MRYLRARVTGDLETFIRHAHTKGNCDLEYVVLPDGSHMVAVENRGPHARAHLEKFAGCTVLPDPLSGQAVGDHALHFAHLKKPPKNTDPAFDAWAAFYRETRHPKFHPEA